MKKILGIIASPRRLGNCEIVAKEISRQITQPHQLLLVRLQDFDIHPCKGCYSCLFGQKRCVQNDDLELVVNAIAEADALIVAAPTYFLGPNASLKRLLDRGLAIYTRIEKLWRKPAIGIALAGIKNKEGYALLGIESFLKLILADVKASCVLYGALPGEVLLNENNLKKVSELAAALLGPHLLPKPGPRCPLCGGDTFRFLDDKTVRCMLCGNTGRFTAEGKKPAFFIEESEHDFFFSKEKAFAHLDWLIGMKQRFLQNKKRLKAVCADYLQDGEWVKPAGEGRMQDADIQKDMETIEKIHQLDMEASREGDIELLLSLMTDDIVLIYPDGEPLRGKAQAKKRLESYREELKNIVITQYLFEFEEVKVIGDDAYEWGSYHHKYYLKSDKKEHAEKGKMMRILRRQPDRSWKVSRSIWTKE